MKLIITIILNLLIVALLSVFFYLGYQLFTASKENEQPLTNFINSKYFLSLLKIEWEENYKTFDSQTFSFEYPDTWDPKRRDLFSDGGETIDLKIPIFYQISKFGGNNIIGYSKEPYDKLRPDQSILISENNITMANRKGLKWKFKQNSLYYYKYVIPLQIYNFSGRQVSSFYLQAESNNENSQLEKVLDHISQSVKLKFEEQK